jgi:hypothetical protein
MMEAITPVATANVARYLAMFEFLTGNQTASGITRLVGLLTIPPAKLKSPAFQDNQRYYVPAEERYVSIRLPLRRLQQGIQPAASHL